MKSRKTSQEGYIITVCLITTGELTLFSQHAIWLVKPMPRLDCAQQHSLLHLKATFCRMYRKLRLKLLCHSEFQSNRLYAVLLKHAQANDEQMAGRKNVGEVLSHHVNARRLQKSHVFALRGKTSRCLSTFQSLHNYARAL